uniref:WASH complex subunit strumpellin n=1 Tax=Phaeomonas parva TaxID=124430 RepID=A0A7S1XR60_9STRA|mmetsp:Transcript_26916/g.84446  ORF Transcript_26916/g.84446 Transcript_26916/m.84446 type:complete len:1068 (+) Transcript_26916:431-3634(+)
MCRPDTSSSTRWTTSSSTTRGGSLCARRSTSSASCCCSWSARSPGPCASAWSSPSTATPGSRRRRRRTSRTCAGFAARRATSAGAVGPNPNPKPEPKPQPQPNRNPKGKPRNYPENFFARFSIDKMVISQIIGRMQNDDIYMQASSFPLPEHRTTRLVAQGSMLYVCLYFAPQLLKGEPATMREIVDRHFSENWVIPAYMGYVVDLSVEWSSYAAAAAALGNVLSAANVQTFARRNKRRAVVAMEKLRGFLTQGRLDEKFLLDNLEALMSCMRESNVALRWRFLHARARSKAYREAIHRECASDDETIALLLQTSQLEWRLKAMFETLLREKASKWQACREQSAERLKELSQYFTGEVLLTRVRRDESMVKWFAGVAQTVASLDYEEEHATVTGRKIREIIRALEEVEGFEQLEESLQVKSFLEDTRNLLRQMLRTVNITGDVMSQMENITDLAYGWELLNDYMAVLQARIEEDPQTVVLLRATFLKLASILDFPLTRISQCDSPDQVSVAEYYSSELVHFVRRVVEVIPKNVFALLRKIVELQSERMRPFPIKLEAEHLKDYAQLNERFELARLTHRVSVFTEGILAMERTLLGVIQVDPRQILEEGLRKELVLQVATAMHKALVFPSGTPEEFASVAKRLGAVVELFRTSMEYIQDYIDLAGLKIWQEEIHRIVNFYIEQETNRFLKKKVLGRQSRYQRREVPVPQFRVLPPPGGRRKAASGEMPALTFMGRVVNALLRLTDPCSTTYAPEYMAWYGSDGTEVCGLKLCSQLSRSVGMTGIQGVDRLLGFQIVYELKGFFGQLQALSKEHGPFLERFRDHLFPEWRIPKEGANLYAQALKKAQKYMLPLLQCCRNVGRAQLLRLQFARLLEFRSRADAQLLHSALNTLNDGIMKDLRRHYANPQLQGHPMPDNPLIGKVRDLLDACGLVNPFSKIYVTTEPVEGLPVMLLLFLISYLPKLRYDPKTGTLARLKDKYPIDGAPVVAGVATLLRQFHPSYTRALLAFLSQFVRTTVYAGVQGSKPAVPIEVATVIVFVRQLCGFYGISNEEIYAYFPPYIFDAINVP